MDAAASSEKLLARGIEEPGVISADDMAPSGRVFVESTPAQIIASVANLNGIQAHQVISTSYLGKHLRLELPLGVVEITDGGRLVAVLDETEDSSEYVTPIQVLCLFPDLSSQGRLSHLRRGDTVRVQGRITAVRGRAIMLDACELWGSPR